MAAAKDVEAAAIGLGAAETSVLLSKATKRVTETSRFAELDALRGLCTCVVVTSHFWFAFGDDVHIPGLFNLTMLAVFVFYAMSGHVIAYGYLLDGSPKSLFSAVFRRLPRLLLPAACANVLAWTLRHVGAFASDQEWRKLSPKGGQGWCSTCFPSDMSLSWAVWSAYEMMFSFEWGVYYFPWQWTIPHEIFGSIIVFMLVPFFRWFVNFRTNGADELVHVGKFCWPLRLQRCILVHSLCLLVLFIVGKVLEHWSRSLALASAGENAEPDFHLSLVIEARIKTAFLFLAGLALAQTSVVFGTLAHGDSSWAHMVSKKWKETYWTQWVAPLSLIVMGLIMPAMLEILPVVFGHVLKYPVFWFRHAKPIVETCGALSVLAGVLCSPVEIRVLLGRFSFLGQITFSIYLLHMLVVFSVGMPLYVWLHHSLSPLITLALILAVCAGPLLLISYAFWLVVEEPLAIRLPRKVVALMWRSFAELPRQSLSQPSSQKALALSRNVMYSLLGLAKKC